MIPALDGHHCGTGKRGRPLGPCRKTVEGMKETGKTWNKIRARMHHKVVENFASAADVRSLYFRGFRFNETSDNGACTHGQPAK